MTFLHGELEKQILIEQSEGFKEQEKYEFVS